MLTKQHLPILGDSYIMVKPQGPYVELPKVEPRKRIFPKENKTVTPKFNEMRPTPAPTKINESPKIDNSYSNGYASSESILDVGYRERGVINNWFIPALDRRLHPPSTLH